MSGSGRITGIGGIFFKARDPDALSQWYVDVLGLPQGEGGISFQSRDETPGAQTLFATFEETSTYFGESAQRFMVNFRVDDLDALLNRLQRAGVQVLPAREEYDFGRFAWIVDPEGNRVELWEPKE